MTYNEPTTVDLAAERPSLIQWPGKQACVTPRRWCSVCIYGFLSGIDPLRSGFYKLIMVHGSCMCDCGASGGQVWQPPVKPGQCQSMGCVQDPAGIEPEERPETHVARQVQHQGQSRGTPGEEQQEQVGSEAAPVVSGSDPQKSASPASPS